jgi:hypothetical protein
MSISEIWTELYSHNSKIQAFAVLEDNRIVWQTDNWNIVSDVDALLGAISLGKEDLTVGGVHYSTVASSHDDYVSTSPDKKGHLLMARVRDNLWYVAWATPDSIPSLTIIDLKYAASRSAFT